VARVPWLLTAVLAAAACTSPSREDLLAGKECAGVDQRCAPGYGCRSDGVCVPEAELAAADGGMGGGGGTGGGTATGSTGGGSTTGGRTGGGGTAGRGVGSTGGTGGGGTGGANGGAATGTGATTSGGAESGGGTGGDVATGGASGGGTGGDVAAGGASGGASPVGCALRAGDCEVIASALRHRYRFEGVGALVLDSVGGADGSTEAGAIQSNGELILSDGSYVDLPNGIVSALADATFEVWVIWNGGADGQRIFDFGDVFVGSDCPVSGDPAPEGAPGICTRTSIYLSPAAAGGPGAGGVVTSVRALRSAFDSIERADAYMTQALPTGTVQHLAVVVDDGSDRLRLYHDGQPVGTTAFTESLSDVSDVNAWLGQAQPASHPGFDGSLFEFRIYGEALTDDEIATSFAEGPDADFLR
jgi:hypothetical protein